MRHPEVRTETTKDPREGTEELVTKAELPAEAGETREAEDPEELVEEVRQSATVAS